MNKKLNIILIILFSICLISSGILAFFPIDETCGPDSGCSIVYASGYGTFLGVDNSQIGFFLFAFLLIITISNLISPKKEKEDIISLAVVVASLVAIYFLFLQIFIIKAFCKYCMVVDISTLLSLATLTYFKYKK